MALKGKLVSANAKRWAVLLVGLLIGVGACQPRVFAPPPLEAIPNDERGAKIRYGYQLVVNTQEHARGHVGNALNCTNCHLDAGRKLHAAPYVGLISVYPEYRSRNAKLNTIEDRLDQCFERSLNGKALSAGSREKEALVAYITWLSEGVSVESAGQWRGFPRIASSRPPNPAKGRTLYTAKCAACHGADGQGTSAAPPVWGPGSFNIGAGMARTSLAAGFIRANMPLGQGGTLSDDEAYDVAAFIVLQPRPDFPGKVNDWPKGGKPADSPY
jgi:thiosulfate dehydrogenase